MKAITLDKLRTLAAAEADAEQGSKAWDKATDALNSKFSPRCLVNLIDQLEAELKRRDDAVPVAWILHARGGDQLTQDGGYVANAEGISGIGSTPLYAAAPAAVLPTDIVITAEVARVGGLILKGCEGEFMDDAARRVFNAMLAAATAPRGGDA